MTEIAVIVALLAQFAGLVWGASKISTTVSLLHDSVRELTRAVGRLDDRVNAHDVEIAVLKREAMRDALKEKVS